MIDQNNTSGATTLADFHRVAEMWYCGLTAVIRRMTHQWPLSFTWLAVLQEKDNVCGHRGQNAVHGGKLCVR